ncbi:MAG TPA: hypothetical protein VEY91_04855, partial [Candidatus Limnocylindria bacterium]|nr:hypothetical protein [Candidatus Limnocylindria bacterium]
DESYQMIATWTGMTGVNDILLASQGIGSQLFILFKREGTGTASRGEVLAFPLTRPTPIPDITFAGLFNPTAMATGNNLLFVLDQGDTALARAPAGELTNLGLYWRVREYGLLGGDTVSTFTDTTVAFVRGIAADAQGRVYVSGTAIIWVPEPNVDPPNFTKTFQFRIFRYVRGPRYPDVTPPDHNLPGANWHRDSTYVVEEGSGVGTVQNPIGIHWSNGGGPALYAADAGKNWVQKLSDQMSNTGFYFLDGGLSGATFSNPEDVTVDRQGYLYIADTGNRRVVRYGPDGTYIQKLNVERDAQGDSLRTPVTVAADDSVAYIGDRETGKVIRYKRRR